MSLAFLAKKSWHTANLKNVEKVWIAEQKHAQEEKKLSELRKQIEEERQLKELRELQAASGNKKAAQEKLDWMYEGPMSHTTNSTEDYLIGKKFTGEKTKSETDLVQSNNPGALWSSTTSAANDSFSRLHEDPMLLIKQRQKAAQENILKNPVKMQRIKNKVQLELEERKRKKKEKKMAKKAKKETEMISRQTLESHKDGISQPNAHSSSLYGRNDRLHRNRSRSPSTSSRHFQRQSNKMEQQHYYPKKIEKEEHRNSSSPSHFHSYKRQKYSPSSRSRRRQHSRSRSRRRQHSRSRSRRRQHSRSRSRRRQHSRSRSRRRRSSSNHRGDDRENSSRKSRKKDSVDLEKDRLVVSEDARENRKDGVQNIETPLVMDDSKYGLKNAENAEKCATADSSTLGPSSIFLDRVRKAKELEEAKKLARLNPKKVELTEEDKARRLQEMRSDGDYAEQIKMRIASAVDSTDTLETHKAQENQASFIKKMTTNVYMESNETMEERLGRNKHYIQKNSDAHNFMQR